MKPSVPAARQSSERKANILLVDDQPTNLLVLRAILEDLNQNLVESHSGEEALRQLLEDDFAVVLLDVNMPGRSGFETAKLIRERDRNRHTPIIFLTAYDSDRLTLETAYSLGAVDFLVKPLIPVILKAKVNGFVELYEKTERSEREANQLRLLINGTTEYAIFMLDPQGYVISWNPGAERLKGYKPVEIIGQHFSRFYPPDALERDWPRHELNVARAEGRFEDEGWRVRKDGSRFWANVVITALYGEAGTLRGFSKITRDLTERRKSEENARRLVEEATARRVAEENTRVIQEFLATLAHELRNPLAPLVNGLQIMKLAINDGQAIEQSRAMMERQLTQLVRLVDDLMDVSRISRGKIDLRKERVELAKVVQQAVETSRPLIDAVGHDLTINLPPDPIYVAADVIRLAQVVSNLLNNAAKYTERGGRITLAVERQGNDAVVSVRDTGIGIPANMIPKLFEIFTQVDRERSQGGLGIGLSLVKGLVEMHSGSIEAKSEGPGKGAEFIVRLPVVEGPVQAPQVSSGNGEKSRTGPKFRILVADDNQDTADSLAIMLRLMRHEIQKAHDGVEAVQVAATFQPDIAVLDIGMPKLNGHDAARHIREQPWGKKMVLVALTGWGQEEDKRRATEAGFDHHMTKPVNMDSLQKLLASLDQTDSARAIRPK